MDRDQFVEQMKTQLDQWNSKIAETEAWMQEKQGEARQEHERQLREMRENRDRAQQQLEDAQKASYESFKEMQTGFMEGWKAIADGCQRAAERLR
ncbi:MAG: hypothetical protein ACFBWO_15780 [Paracoccaceae bacterium]